TPGVCNTATNQYSISGIISLTNAVAGTATITDGTSTTTVTVAAGATSVAYSLGSFNSDASSHTVTVSYGGKIASAIYTAPASCTVAATIVVTSATICAGSSATLTASGCLGNVTWSNSTDGVLLLTPVLTQTTTYTAVCTTSSGMSASAVATVTVVPIPSLSLQASTTLVVVGNPVSLSALGCTNGVLDWSTGSQDAGQSSIVVSPTVTTSYAVSCTSGLNCVAVQSLTVVVSQPSTPILSLVKLVDKSIAQLGDLVNYTIVVSNQGAGDATDVIVRDSISAGLSIIPGSVTTSIATSYTLGDPISQWKINSLSANTSATIVFQGRITKEGVVSNKAMIPGDTASVCTSVPVKVCKGSTYAIVLTAAPGYNRYQWYRQSGTGTEEIVYDGSLASYTATAAGVYRVVINNGAVSCSKALCCPTIIEEDSVASFSVIAQSPTCIANEPQANGRLIVLGQGLDGAGYQYAISEGNSFSLTNPVFQSLPADRVVATGLKESKTYTVRIINALGCYRDQTVTLNVNCACPPKICLPITIKRTKFTSRR
uniref:DUF11 domain-containing protein n=1 Tax=uncultured Spirosoma sp. TaxID=278208 RepID=UPI00261626C4